MTPRWNPERKAWVFVARSTRTPAMGADQKRRKRTALITQYGCHCWLCNKPIIGEEPTLDHVTPRALGGSHRLSNLRLAHLRCNLRRGDGPVPELLLTSAMRVRAKEPA